MEIKSNSKKKEKKKKEPPFLSGFLVTPFEAQPVSFTPERRENSPRG